MPGVAHETVIQLLTDPPGLVGVLLTNLGYTLPDGDAKLVDSALSGHELRADKVVVIGDGSDALAVVLEVQTAPPSLDKWRTWVAYAALAGREHRCQALVLVVARRDDTARRCRARSPYAFGPDSQLAVAVIGPDNLAGGPPRRVDPATWAVLAVACSALDLHKPADRLRALNAVAQASAEHVGRYYKLILAMAPEAAVAPLEELMATEYRESIIDRAIADGEATGRQHGEAIGRQQGARQALLAVLAARDIELPARVRDAVMECADSDQLDTWVGRAANASTLHDVFGDRLSDWV